MRHEWNGQKRCRSCRTDLSVTLTALTSARDTTSASAVSAWPSLQANISAVCPLGSRASGSAPYANRSRMTSVQPLDAASCLKFWTPQRRT